jgi:hypothetical protein
MFSRLFSSRIAMLDAKVIVKHQDMATADWHQTPIPIGGPPFFALILHQHRANFDLWHCEDSARDPSAADSTIVQAKRDIDRHNQDRNDLVEMIDSALLQSLPSPDEAAPLHSETPGLIIDRLSILSLKIFHTEEETHRASASAEHHERNRERLAILRSQRTDLASCLDQLWSEVQHGRRRFKLYRQLKMYNDPTLNPVLYRNTKVEPPEPKGS